MIELNPVERRVLAALIEKKYTTPDYYPMTLNALVAACNQKSNRSPVMQLSQDQVQEALESLAPKHAAASLYVSGSRVMRYIHRLDKVLSINELEVAVLAELMMRGAQTLSELKTRTHRFFADDPEIAFKSLEDVRETVEALMNYADGALVSLAPRKSGQKEQRYIDIFAPQDDEEEECPESPAEKETETSLKNRVSELEERVGKLEEIIESLL